LNIIRNTNEALYNKAVDGLKAAASKNKEVAASIAWAEKNYNEDGQQTVDDEALVETIAKVGDGTLDISKLPTSLKQDIIDIINKLASAIGLPPVSDTDVEAFRKVATQVSNMLKSGTNVEDVVGKGNATKFQNNIESGLPNGNPMQLRAGGEIASEPVKLKDDGHKLSFVTKDKLFDVIGLIDEIKAKDQKVWFWTADQLGRGFIYDKVIEGEHYLDAGPSFALDPENVKNGVIWASGMNQNQLKNKIADSDYIFIISGSPQNSKLFNKKVSELVKKRIEKSIEGEDKFNTFKTKILEVSKINSKGGLNEILSKYNSFDELFGGQDRKPFLIEINKVAEKKGTPLKSLLEKFNAFVNPNELRDGFFADNNFDLNDVMLVLKPTALGGKSKHSTYENDILGEVVGVPNRKVNAWDIIPEKMKKASATTSSQKAQVIAPYGSRVTKIQARVGDNLIEKAGVEKEMTEDGKGNYIFYHYTDKNIKTIDPEKFGSNTRATGKDEKAGVGISMYYTRPDRIEANVSNDNGYVVRVPMSKVYPFNADPLNLLEKAEKEFRKEYGPDAAFDLNKQVGYVTKIAGKLGYKMTVAEWNIGKKKALRAQTTEAMKPEVYSKIKSGTFNQIEFNPELEGLKANASKKKMQARISAEFSPQDLKNYSKLANFDKYGKPSNVVTLAEIGIDSSITNAKQAADKLAEFEGPFQPIAKAIAKIPKLEKVLFHIDPTSLDMGYGTAVGMYYTLPKVWVWEEEVKAVRVSDVKKNTYMNTIHELLHWVTMDSVMSDKGSPEYTALKSIFNYLETHDKFKDIPRLSRQAEKNYGMFSWNEFLVEIFANSEFRDNISDIFATKEELEKVNLKPSSFTDDWDRYGLGFAIYEYITKLFKKSIPDVTEGIDFDKPLLDNALDLATRLFINRDYGKDKPVTKAEVKKAVQARISNEFSADDLKRYNKLKNYNKYGSRYNQVSLKDLGVDDSVTNAKQFAEKLAEFDGPLKPLAIVISRIPSLDKVYFAKQDGYIPLAHMKVGKASGTFGPMPKTFIWEKEEYILKMGDNQIENNYLVGLHELMHWVTLQSPVVDTKDPDYKALQRIYTFLNTHEKFKDVPSNDRFDVRTYGMYNFDEFMVELFTSPHFRENIQDIFATKEDFIEANIDKSTFGDNWDRFGLGYAIYEYVAKLLRKAVPDYAAGIDFDKSILDNALELATRTFINKAVEISASDKKSDSKSSTLGSTSNYKGGSVVDFLESVGMKSDFNSRKELATKNGISNYTGSAQQNTELLSKLKSSKVSTTAQARVEDGEDTGEKNRGLEKTFSQRNSETVARINEDAKTYFQISNKQTTEEVNKFMEGKDVEEVTNYLLTEPNNIAGRVRIWMSGVAMDGLDKKIVEAEKNGDKKAVARLAEKQAQLINQVAPLGTELGQAIQAFRRFYQNNSGSPAMFNHFSNGLISKIEKEANRKLSEEEIEKIKEFAKQIQDAKEGLPKDEATFALGNYVGKIVPVSATDILQSIWYAHILSGVTTQTTNFFANFWNTFAEGAVTGIRESFKSRSLMPMIVGMKGFIDGVKIGASEGADIFLTGITAQDANKFVNKDLLEYFSWKQTKLGKLGGGKVGKFMDKAGSWSPAVLKYVGRALAATDAAFSRSNTEAMSRMMAYTQAKKEGAEDVQKRAREILYNTKENVAEAKAQATEEGYVEGTRKYKRRVYEIMEQKRGAEFNQKAQAYGTKVTLNYEPEGFTRPLYNAAVALQESSKFAKLFIPFTRIIANITENSLNYTPLGFIKAGVGSTNSEGGRRKLTADERADYAIKAAIGVATFITLAGLTGDKEDDLFDITANGAADMQKNYELRKSGWRPYSIKLKNGKYISYKDWPIMPLLAALGAMHDSDKYEKDSPEVSDRAKIALWGLANSVYDKSVMKGIQDFAEILKPKAEYNQSSRIGERLMSWGADQASTMLISNFTKQNIKFVMESMDSPVKAAKGIQRIYKDIPFLNDGLNPIIDVFGEPVTQTTSEKLLPITIGKISKDEMLSVINENGIFIGKPQTRDIFIDDKTGETRPMTDQEYYEFTKKSGQLTKKYLAEDWKDIQEALRIKDPKEKSETLQAIISSIVSDARDEAMEMFYDANGRAIKPTNQNKK
jgi:hypothetical protein